MLNVAKGPAYISITMNFTEDKTVLDFAYFSFTSPSGRKRSCGLMSVFSLTWGDIYRGTVASSTTCKFPRGSEGGNWSLDVVRINDRSASRNARSYQRSELAALAALWGFPTQFLVVSSGPDVDAPTMTGLAISPSMLNVAKGPAYISITMNFTEDKTGLDFAYFSFTSPSGRKRSCGLMSVFSLTSGDIYRGTVASSTMCKFPRGSEGGNWSLDVVRINDRSASRNARSYQRSELAALAALWGFPTQFLVVSSGPDVDAPTMTGLAISPSTLNVTNSPAYISITMNFNEDETGLDFASLSFTSPSGRTRTCGLMAIFSVTSGDIYRGTVAG